MPKVSGIEVDHDRILIHDAYALACSNDIDAGMKVEFFANDLCRLWNLLQFGMDRQFFILGRIEAEGGRAGENFGLPNLTELATCGFVQLRRERDLFAEYVDKLQIKTPSAEQLARNLSGGNQQKVVLAKWLQRNSEVIIFDEPTRGIDVGAKYEIYMLMNELAKQGKAVIMVSSELPEVLGMSDRIVVMHEGRITGEVSNVSSATQEQIMELAVG